MTRQVKLSAGALLLVWGLSGCALTCRSDGHVWHIPQDCVAR